MLSTIFNHTISLLATKYFLNALVERDTSKLQKVGVIRLASCNFTKNAPPFVDFPVELRDTILGHIGFIEGGLNVDGTIIGSPNRVDVSEECNILRSKDIQNIVVVGTFSPVDVDHKQEEVVRDWILEELGNVNVVCSAQGRRSLQP
jgi:N-methylhydantoinase A/oxoprolinase/acetone carboxylase beta subunit